MPWQAPRFGRQAAKREAWARPKRQIDHRLRGRPGMRLRALVKDEEPYCRHCLAKGLRVATDEVDHIIELADGGTNDRANMQGLCEPCHRTKSKLARERRRNARKQR